MNLSIRPNYSPNSKPKNTNYSRPSSRPCAKSIDKIFILPTSLAVTKAAVLQVKGELPGVESLHKLVTRKDRSIWWDHRGHLGPGFDRLEGYVFYATLYKKSPELIKTEIALPKSRQNFPSPELDKLFRKIAWEAVTENPLSGVIDADGDGVGD